MTANLVLLLFLTAFSTSAGDGLEEGLHQSEASRNDNRKGNRSNGVLWLSFHGSTSELSALTDTWYFHGAEGVRKVLDHGFNVNVLSPKNGRSALMEAAYIGIYQLAKLAIDYGADVDLIGWSQMTALHYAAMGDNFDIAQLLLQRGADVNAKNEADWTPLMFAARWSEDEHLIRLMVSHGASRDGCTTSFSSRCDINNTELHRQLGQAAEDGNVEQVRRLLLLGYIDANWRDENQYTNCDSPLRNATALHRAAACEKGDFLEITKLLLENDAQVNLRESYYEQTALHLAAQKGNATLVKLLVDQGAELDARNMANWTPLLCAARAGKEDVFRFLISRGATRVPWCDPNFSPLCAIDNTPLHRQLIESAGVGNLEDVKYLLQLGYVDVNWRDAATYSGCGYPIKNATALIRAVACQKERVLEVVQELLENGAQINVSENYANKTALHFAADVGDAQLVEKLLDNGANVNATTSFNWTPLMLAARWGKVDVIRLLLKHGSIRDGCKTSFSVYCDTSM